MKFKVSILAILICLPLICFTVSAYAAPAPEGFLGVPWGASRAQVKQAMNERGWVRATGAPPTDEVFKGSFADNPCDLHFVFVGNSFVDGYATPLARTSIRYLAGTRRVYESTINRLTERYGPPQKTEVGGFGPSGVTAGPTTTWEFGDGVTSDRYTIRAILFIEGTWFADVDVKQVFYEVVYENSSLRERLKNKDM